MPLDSLALVERRWHAAKVAQGIDPHKPVKFSKGWPDSREPRSALTETIGQLPILGVVALLEDNRPHHVRQQQGRGSDMYIVKRGFAYVLQRLATNYFEPTDSANLVAFDNRDEFDTLARVHTDAYRNPQQLRYNLVPALKECNVCGDLLASNGGATNEIADFVVSSLTRWSAQRVLHLQGKAAPDLAEFQRACRALMPLFPVDGGGKRRGYSVVTFTQGLSDKDVLKTYIEGWIRNALDGLP